MKPYRVEYIQLTEWEAEEMGLWLAENEDWLLLRSIPVDYVIDGYILIAKRHIESREPRPGRTQVQRVLKLKGIAAELPMGFAFADTIGLLQWVEKNYGLVEFQDEEATTFLGWLRDINTQGFQINTLTPKGKVNRNYGVWFDKEKVRTIKFDNDYFNALKLLWQDNTRKQWNMPNDN